MAKVRFNLQPTPAGTVIRLVFRFGGHKFVYYTGFLVIRNDWNGKAMELRKGAHQWQEINAGLRRLKNEVERIYHTSLGQPIPLSPNSLKLDLDVFWKGKKSGKAESVPEFIRSMALDRVGSGQIKASTSKALNTLASQIERFRRGVQFSDITLDFHRDFTTFLIAENKSPNTVAGSIKRLKSIMGQAVDRGLTDNQSFRSVRFVAKEIEVDNIYLTEADLQGLESVELFRTKHFEAVRDSFLLGVYTGLRYSDFSELEPTDFQTYDGVFMVRKRMKKTGRVIAAPINDKALAILQRHNMRPPNISNQVLNRYIKQVAQLAGINEMVKIEQVRGRERKVVILPKWKLVSTHTARRTFATLGYLRAIRSGRDYEPIMDILGHKSRVTFLKYIKVSPEERAAIWAKASG